MDTSNYLSIGEFAELSGIKRKTLIYYDQIGLLVPIQKAQNGYRYYDYPQLYRVNMINLFKEIGMPLVEIKDHLQNSTPEQAALLLKRQRERIHQKQQHYDQMARMVDQQLASLEEYALADELKFSIESYERVPLFFSSRVYRKPNFRASISLSEVYQQSFSAGYQFIYPAGIVFRNSAESSDYVSFESIEVQYYVKVPGADEARPAGKYVICYFYGGTEYLNIFHRTFAYLKENQLRAVSDIYVDVILNGLSAQKFDDFLLKLLVQVEPL